MGNDMDINALIPVLQVQSESQIIDDLVWRLIHLDLNLLAACSRAQSLKKIGSDSTQNSDTNTLIDVEMEVQVPYENMLEIVTGTVLDGDTSEKKIALA